MRIHEDKNGLRVNAISALGCGTDVNGTLYHVEADGAGYSEIKFHSGSVANGLVGHTSESVLAILEHRMKVVDGKCPSPQNKAAIDHIQQALAALSDRVDDREARGVTGTQKL